MTLHEPETPLSVDRDIPDTEVIALSAPTPVFVDSTGRRRKMLRRLAYAFGALCMLYGGLISVSLAGGPVSSSAILPLPDLPLRAAKPAAPKPSPTPVPTATAPAPAEFAAGPLTRRPVDFGRTIRRTPAVIPAPTTVKPTVSPTTSRTVESTATASPTPTASGSGTPSKTPSSSPAVPPPSPPSSPTTKSDTGGAGGGEEAPTPAPSATTGGDTKVGALGRTEVAEGRNEVGDQLGAEIGNDLAGEIGARIGSILSTGEAA